MRRREWATSGHDGLGRNHGATHGGSDGGGGEISGSSEVRGSHAFAAAEYKARPKSGRWPLFFLCGPFCLRHVPGAGRAFAEQIGDALGSRFEPWRISGSASGKRCRGNLHHIAKAFADEGRRAAGIFLAAVGADHPEKQELDPALMAACKVVADVAEQCAAIGDLHHAIAARTMQLSDVHAELGEIVAGRKPGRRSPEEMIIFDSTGHGPAGCSGCSRGLRKCACCRL